MSINRSSSSKRTLADTDDEQIQPTKRNKLTGSQSNGSFSGQPTNKVLPEHISFTARPSNTVRITAWNICGYAASQKKGFKRYIEAEDADILVLTETKVNSPPVGLGLKVNYPHAYWSISAKKSYGGIAILSKLKPLSVSMTLPGHPDPESVKGRIITLEFENTYVVGTYVVNAGTGLKTLDAKKEWNVHFTKYIRELDQKKPVIWTGDLNVAPTEIDLANAKSNWNKTPGYTEAETSAFRQILEGSKDGNEGKPEKLSEPQFVDVWRQSHPSERGYTYFSYRFNCREKGLGWRLDMFVLSRSLVDRVQMCEIRGEIYGASDHCPIVMDYEGDL
ncbi:hypothetical protein AX16_008881 [Volvariella volvacea WC 439]|nr:hypothetical protein AX16_008881 [Volvariella volvacea WC 439]